MLPTYPSLKTMKLTKGKTKVSPSLSAVTANPPSHDNPPIEEGMIKKYKKKETVHNLGGILYCF